jgi:hypothetical protein
MHEGQDHYDTFATLAIFAKSLEPITHSSKKIICTIRDTETKRCSLTEIFDYIELDIIYSGHGAGLEIVGMAR